MLRLFRSHAALRTLCSTSCRPLGYQRRNFASENDAPVKFSASAASGWKAAFSREGINEPDDSAWFQPYVVVTSLAVFLIYFCILREENDVDEKLSMSLYDRIDGLEKVQLEAALIYYSDLGKDTTAIRNRLEELKRIEEKAIAAKST